jgi:3-phenylpropionate/cinnamic acid dioxygenase small subunit
MTPEAFVYHEARLLDERQWDAWYELFAEDGIYWVPVVHGQEDGITHTSLAYEDRLLLRLRIERLKQRPFSQQPESRSQHVLQAPLIEQDAAGALTLRTPFQYAEARGDEYLQFNGVVLHHLLREGETFRIRLKRVNLLNCEAALPSIQLFF